MRGPLVILLAAVLAAGAVLAAVLGGDRRDPETRTAPIATPREPDRPTRLLDALRRGGTVLAFRHAAAQPNAEDRDPTYRDCSRQRRLTARGREQARTIGRAFAARGIPVGEVLASPYCRSRDTAELAFGRAEVERDLLPLAELREAGVRDPAERFRDLLRRTPRAGTNTVLVGHSQALEEVAGELVDEGEALVVAPGGGADGFELLGRVDPSDWEALAGR